MSADPFQQTTVDEGDFEIDLGVIDHSVIPEGPCVVECILVSKGTSQAGHPKIMFDFKVLANEKGKAYEFTGKSPKTLHCTLNPEALWKLEETLLALGVAKVGQKVGYRYIKDHAEGARALALIKHSEWRNRKQADIDEMRPFTGGVEVKTDNVPI